MRQAFILVGGKGTRLGGAARDTPKPLLPIVGDVRFLDYLIEDLARHGFTDIILLAGHQGEQVVQRYRGTQVRGASLDVFIEPAPAGTGGALARAAQRLDDVFLLINGDSYFEMNYLALAQALTPDAAGALALRAVPDAARYGRVEFKGDRISAFHEKDASWTAPALISAGVYALRKTEFGPLSAGPASLELDLFPGLAAQGKLRGRIFDGYFIDIGLPDTLARARAELPAQMRRPAIFFDRDGTLNYDKGYTHEPEDLVWMPGAVEAIRACNDRGALAIVITNQSGIARGLYDEAQAIAFHQHMNQVLAHDGAHIDAFYYCPFHADAVVADYRIADHPDRKPHPGMILRALHDWRIDPARAFFIGDQATDIEAATAAGVPSRLVKEGELLAAVLNALER